MGAFKRIMVGIDFSQMDATLLRYAAFVASVAGTQKVYLLHVVKVLDDLEDTPADELLKERMRAEAAGFFAHLPAGLDMEHMVVEDEKPLHALLHWSGVKAVDLLVAGRKSKREDDGIAPNLLARKSRTALLLVPDGARPQIERVLLPIDLSDNARQILKFAIDLTHRLPEMKIVCHYIYKVRQGWNVLFSPETSSENEEEFAEGYFKAFLKEVPEAENINITPIYSANEGYDKGELIYLTAQKCKAGLIVVGAKGRTSPAAVLLGSTTEQLIKHNDGIPLLILKIKDRVFGFFDAILSGD